MAESTPLEDIETGKTQRKAHLLWIMRVKCKEQSDLKGWGCVIAKYK